MNNLNDIIDYYYDIGNVTGGSLHIVLDDNNLDHGSIEWCFNHALEKKIIWELT